MSKMFSNVDVKVLDLSRSERKIISNYVDDYAFLGGEMFWMTEEMIS